MAGIQAEHLVRSYTMGQNVIRAVDDISFAIPEGRYTIILGASGAGKSTVLNLLGGMDSPTSGRLWAAGREISGYNKRQLAEYRRSCVGFVFQFYNLMPNLNMLENVELASQICKAPLEAREVLELVPRAVVLGVGCRRGVETEILESCVTEALEQIGVGKEAVSCLASIDIKREEPAIIELADRHGWDLQFFSAEQLQQVEGDFESSDFVRRTVGVGNVCGRAAVAASGHGKLILTKHAGRGVTVAAAVKYIRLIG